MRIEREETPSISAVKRSTETTRLTDGSHSKGDYSTEKGLGAKMGRSEKPPFDESFDNISPNYDNKGRPVSQDRLGEKFDASA